MAIFDRLIRQDDAQGAEQRRSQMLKGILSELSKNVASFVQGNPEMEELITDFGIDLEKECRKRYKRAVFSGDDHVRVDALARFCVSKDRMQAFACLLPPVNGGKEISLESLQRDVHYEGITYGILEEELAGHIGRKHYLEILPIAQGVNKHDGEDGWIEPLFDVQEETGLEVDFNAKADFGALVDASKGIGQVCCYGRAIDFGADRLVQTVKKGQVICRIHPPCASVDGIDVCGRRLPSREVKSAKPPKGTNTELSSDGKQLTAAMDGILYTKGGNFCVREQRLFEGSLSGYDGTLKIKELYIPGDVDGGITIEAVGDVIIAGEVRNASITSQTGTIRVQKGVCGVEGKTFLKAFKQVQARSIERARVEAGGEIIAEVVMDSELVSGASISVEGGRGLIAGGSVEAAGDVYCAQLGNISGKATVVFAGSSPEKARRRAGLKEELAATQQTLKKLWDSISGIRKTTPDLRDKALLEQLVEQRALYEAQEKRQKEELKALIEEARTVSGRRVKAGQICPGSEITIGLYKLKFESQEQNCDVHAYGDRLIVR